MNPLPWVLVAMLLLAVGIWAFYLVAIAIVEQQQKRDRD